jgi:soluble lytic murein transglycosylase-like protein
MYDKNLRNRMAAMSPQELQKYAMMNKNDPFLVAMALDIDKVRQAGQRQKALEAVNQEQPPIVDQNIAAIGQPEMPPEAMQAAPQAQAGLPQIPAQNIATMADGGIAGYAEGKEVKGGRDEYRAYAMQKAQQLGLDPSFVDGIFKVESNYDPKAKSKTGPQGIGQLTEYIAKTFGISPKDRLDPYKNMDASLGFMDYLNKKYKGDKSKMAVAYNQGEPVLDAHLKQNKGQLVPENLHLNVKTANKNEPANYLKKMMDAGALTAPATQPTQTAETGTREAPRTPEMLARQKAAIARRELLASLPLSAAQAGESASRDPSQPSLIDKLQRAAPPALGGKGELVSEVFGKNKTATPPVALTPNRTLPVTKEGKSAPIVDDSVYDPMTGALISGGVPSTVGPQTKYPELAQAAGLVDILPKAIYGLGTTASENVLALPFGKDVPTEKRRETAQKIMAPFYKYGTLGGISGLANDPAYASDPASQLLNVVQNNLEKSDEAIAAMTGAKPDNVRLARENVMAVLPLAGKIKPVETGMPKLPGKGKPTVAAETAAAEAAAQTTRAAEAEAKIAAPRLPAPTTETPGVIRQTPAGEAVLPTGKAAAAEKLGLAGLADDVNAANMARKSATAAEALANASRAAETQTAAGAARSNKLTNAGKAAAAISSAGVGLEEPTEMYGGAEKTRSRGYGLSDAITDSYMTSGMGDYKFNKPTEKPTVETTTPSAPTAPTKKTGLGALSDEDWLMMGLNMLQAPAGQPGGELSQLGQNIGRAGIATLGSKKEREKTEFEKLQKQALTDYYKGMTENLGREPDTIRQLRALQADPKLMETMMRMEAGKDIVGQRARILQVYDAGVASGAIDPATMSREQFLRQYGGPLLGGNADLFKVVGSRPS